MKTSSAKAKGRRACAEFRDALLRTFPTLHEDDIRVTSSSVPGEDIQMSHAARTMIPFVVEAKNQEAFNIWAAIKQAREHSDNSKEKHSPLVVFKRNGEPLRVVLELEDFLKFLEYRNEVLNDNKAAVKYPDSYPKTPLEKLFETIPSHPIQFSQADIQEMVKELADRHVELGHPKKPA